MIKLHSPVHTTGLIATAQDATMLYNKATLSGGEVSATYVAVSKFGRKHYQAFDGCEWYEFYAVDDDTARWFWGQVMLLAPKRLQEVVTEYRPVPL